MHDCRIAEAMWRALGFGLILLGGFCTMIAQVSNDSRLMEAGTPARLEKPQGDSTAISIVTYNIRWRTADELKQIGNWLRDKHPALIALQEVDRAKERTNKTNNARALAEQLGMHYAWAAPPLPKSSRDKEEETGVEILSPYPLTDVTRIVLPHEGPGGRWRVTLGATIRIGKTAVRAYSVHSETRIPLDQKLDQYRAVLDDLKRFPKSTPAIIMGDFNSWEPATVKAVRKLFLSETFITPFADEESTFKRNAVLFDLTLKLDWIWLRGLKATDSAIGRSLTVSDHYPLWLTCSFQNPAP